VDIAIKRKVDELIVKGWYYQAALEVGQYLYFTNCSIDEINIYFSHEQWKIIEQDSKHQLNKGINILSYGKIWDEDELLLVITIILNLYMITIMFKAYKHTLDLDLSYLKGLLHNIDLKEPRNNKSIHSVAKMMNKNSKVKEWKDITEFSSLRY